MNTKEYIESGILEVYVSGAANDQERREVQCLATVYPEIRAELVALEETMNQFSTEFKASPPSGLKNNILAAIKDTPQIPVEKQVGDQSNMDGKTTETKPIEMTVSKRDISHFPWRLAASVLLLVSSGLLYFLITQQNDYQAILESQNDNISQLQNELEDLTLEVKDQNEQLAVISSPSTLKIPLGSPTGDAQDMALVFWDASNQNVYLDPDQLPSIDEEFQYQLWALKDNQPIDLGTVLKGNIGFQKMKSVDAADAFAITLEPLGGSEVPTLEQLKVIGQI